MRSERPALYLAISTIRCCSYFFTGVWGGPPRRSGGRGVKIAMIRRPGRLTSSMLLIVEPAGTDRYLVVGKWRVRFNRLRVPHLALSVVAPTACLCMAPDGLSPDLYCQRQLQGSGKTADQIDRNPPDIAFTVLDGEKGRSNRCGNHATAKFAGWRKLFEVFRTCHDAAFNMRRRGRLRSPLSCVADSPDW